MQDNPLSKIPTLVLDDGTVLYDSRVICEYLDALHGGHTMFPRDGRERLTALRRQALGDGALDFLLLLRNERERPQPSPSAPRRLHRPRSRASSRRSSGKPASSPRTPFNIGHVAIGTALSYLDFRFADDDWRTPHPRIAQWHRDFSARPSVRATEPIDDS